jgi:hypothetical protein
MNAAEAINQATAVGIRIAIEGNDLLLEAAGPPPMTVIELLSRHKPDIVNLLRSSDGSLADALAALECKCPGGNSASRTLDDSYKAGVIRPRPSDGTPKIYLDYTNRRYSLIRPMTGFPVTMPQACCGYCEVVAFLLLQGQPQQFRLRPAIQ